MASPSVPVPVPSSTTEQRTFCPDGDLILTLDRRFAKSIIPRHLLPLDTSNNTTGASSRSTAVHFFVSSQHLILASDVFKATLQGKFKEGVARSSSSKTGFCLPEDDFEAFTILMNIVHGHGSKVPRTVNVDMLLRLAILVDKYHMLEVTQIYSLQWFQSCVVDINTPIELIAPFIAVAWVFGASTHFKAATQLAMVLVGDEYTLDACFGVELPTPLSVAAAIKSSRIASMSRLFEALDAFIEDHRNKTVTRRFWERRGNDEMDLGAFMNQGKLYLTWPPPPMTSAQYGKSFVDIRDTINKMNICGLCQFIEKNQEHSCFHPLHNRVKGQLDKRMGEIQDATLGLDVEGYMLSKNSRSYRLGVYGNVLRLQHNLA